MHRGPAAVLLLSLGVVSRERFSCLEMVKEYIRHKQLFEVNELLIDLLLFSSPEPLGSQGELIGWP